ncbi:hypothetical protein STW0522RAO56_10930 [Raoultella planticola]|nr:hypothetical protein STW0522RAO56_10930 [Raoultella planticola]
MNIFQNMSPDDWENFSSYYLGKVRISGEILLG